MRGGELKEEIMRALNSGLIHADEIAERVKRPQNQVRVILDRLRVDGDVIHKPAVNGRDRVTWHIKKPCLLSLHWKGVIHA